MFYLQRKENVIEGTAESDEYVEYLMSNGNFQIVEINDWFQLTFPK